ncbi:BID domain-containing T4SS effector [Bartonella jaculi]|uniref:Uncharacterized protein n=1 Tax=Bartonella jaculi TaxID=686226 RepID=A0ABP9N2F0_9HYPH
MKKNQSSPSLSNVSGLKKRFEQTPEENPIPEPVYAKVNKSNRTSPKPQPEEVLYAEINTGGRGRGQHQHNPSDPVYENVNTGSRGQHPHAPETVYAEINTGGRGRGQHQHNPSDPVYAELNIGGGGRGQHQRNPSDSDYENVNPRSKGQHQHNPSDPVYAELNIGGGGRGQHQRNPSDSDYENVTPRGRGQHQHTPDTVYATVKQGGPTSPTHMTLKDKVTSGILKDPGFQGRVERLQGLCTIVYGDQHALNTQLSEILDNPRRGEEILQNLMENPNSPGKLAGQKILGVKSPDRKTAEEGFSVLCAVLEDHVEATRKLHKDLTRGLTKQQGHERDAHHHHHERHEHQHSPKQDMQRHREEKRMAFAL